jgi:uncharacterized protein YjbI with pentapeptide repeats
VTRIGYFFIHHRLLTDLIIATVSLIIGIIGSTWYDEYVEKSPQKLGGLLENNKIQEFNDLRKQINVKIDLSGIDLSGKDLRGADLRSLILNNVNLSNANLENTNLENLKVSGDLYDINMNNASLHRADLSNADLSRANMKKAILIFTNLEKTFMGGIKPIRS